MPALLVSKTCCVWLESPPFPADVLILLAFIIVYYTELAGFDPNSCITLVQNTGETQDNGEEMTSGAAEKASILASIGAMLLSFRTMLA